MFVGLTLNRNSFPPSHLEATLYLLVSKCLHISRAFTLWHPLDISNHIFQFTKWCFHISVVMWFLAYNKIFVAVFLYFFPVTFFVTLSDVMLDTQSWTSVLNELVLQWLDFLIIPDGHKCLHICFCPAGLTFKMLEMMMMGKWHTTDLQCVQPYLYR